MVGFIDTRLPAGERVFDVTTGSKSEYLQQLKQRALDEPDASEAYVEMSASDIRSLRSSVGLAQPDFARLLGVGPFVMREWEIGTRRPDRKQLALLRLIDAECEHIAQLK